MRAEVLDEPLLEFGYSGTHQDQRAGLTEYGPADIEADSRPSTIRVGIVGRAAEAAELREYLSESARGVPAKDTPLTNLFPPFAGATPDDGFRAEIVTSIDTHRPLSRPQFKTISDAESEADKILAAVELCAQEALALGDSETVDVIFVVRPPGVPDGTTGVVGANFRNLLKAALIEMRQPTQIIRPSTWRGGRGVEDPATRAWNLFTATYYKAGGKPWRLLTDRRALSRCYVGVSFTQSRQGQRLFASVAQVFNELGDGVVVRGGLAERSGPDLQPHLSEVDAKELLADALERYADEHKTKPAALTLHKTSSFSDEEQRGFLAAADDAGLANCELFWLTHSDNAMLVRGSHYYPPMRGTLFSLSDEEHVLYTHGSVPYYQTYPGMYVPRPLGIRPAAIDRPIAEVASEILSLTKLNWNRVRMDARLPITLSPRTESERSCGTCRTTSSPLRATPTTCDGVSSLKGGRATPGACLRWSGDDDDHALQDRRRLPCRRPVARFITVLAMMSNDWLRSAEEMLGIADGSTDEGGRRVMLFRQQASLHHEAATFIVDAHRRFPAIAEFVDGLPEVAREECAKVLGGIDPKSPHYHGDWLADHRNVTFHYPEMHPDKATHGAEEIHKALTKAADIESTISSGGAFGTVRFGFADDVAVQWLPDIETDRDDISQLREAVMALARFVQRAAGAYLDSRPDGTVTVERD